MRICRERGEGLPPFAAFFLKINDSLWERSPYF